MFYTLVGIKLQYNPFNDGQSLQIANSLPIIYEWSILRPLIYGLLQTRILFSQHNSHTVATFYAKSVQYRWISTVSCTAIEIVLQSPAYDYGLTFSNSMITVREVLLCPPSNRVNPYIYNQSETYRLSQLQKDISCPHITWITIMILVCLNWVVCELINAFQNEVH